MELVLRSDMEAGAGPYLNALDRGFSGATFSGHEKPLWEGLFMVLVLALIGLAMAIWTWNNVHPLAALIVGFLFVGGAGWKLVGAALSSLVQPRAARAAHGAAGRQFILAWEKRLGDMVPGQEYNLPPPGTFQAWLRDYRRTGVDAASWLDRHFAEPIAVPNQVECELVPLIASQPGGPGGAVALDDRILVRLTSGQQIQFKFEDNVIAHCEAGTLYGKPYEGLTIHFAGGYALIIKAGDLSPWVGVLEGHEIERK